MYLKYIFDIKINFLIYSQAYFALVATLLTVFGKVGFETILATTGAAVTAPIYKTGAISSWSSA